MSRPIRPSSRRSRWPSTARASACRSRTAAAVSEARRGLYFAPMADTTIPDKSLASIVDVLDKANVGVAERFPGDSSARQPVHVVYGGAHLFTADAAHKLGGVALRTLREHAPDAASLASALGLDPAIAARIYPRVVEKLTREPVEDFRIDFENGFGNRPDQEEDRFARSAAGEVAAAMAHRTLPPSIGI